MAVPLIIDLKSCLVSSPGNHGTLSSICFGPEQFDFDVIDFAVDILVCTVSSLLLL